MAPQIPSQASARSEQNLVHAGRSPSQSSDDAVDTEQHFENASDIAELKAGLCLTPKHIPCGYLYDDKGSQLYDEITKLDEYYPFKTEKELLTEHATAIVSSIPPGSIVVELGCGTAEKTSIILHALMARDGPNNVHFLGIDVSMEALHLARSNVVKQCPELSAKNVEMVCAEYLQGLKQARARHPEAMLCVLWLGSSVGNLKPQEAVGFFKSVLQSAGVMTQVFLCTDLWKDANVLHSAYHDSQGVTEAFIKNGMVHALHALGLKQHADPHAWTYDVVINPVNKRVEMWLVASEKIHIAEGISIAQGERILMEVSRKFTLDDIRQLAFQSDFYVQDTWRNSKYSMQMLVHTSQAIQRCWTAADEFFGNIKDWSVQPIDVRRPFGFYYGHMASFAKLKLLPNDKESEWDKMYSRGIDPNMADPSKCHAHPEAPPEWPAKPEVQAYAQKVRAKLMDALKKGEVTTRNAYLIIEHEWMHLETLSYMLAQEQRMGWERSHGTHPAAPNTPSKAAGFRAQTDSISGSSDDEAQPHGNGGSHGAHMNAHANGGLHSGQHSKASTNGRAQSHGVTDGFSNSKPHCRSSSQHDFIQIPSGSVTLGTDMDPSKSFAWDNEGPQQQLQEVRGFQAANRPVSNAQYYEFAVTARGYEKTDCWDPKDYALFQKRTQTCPATWTVQSDGGVFVHIPGKTQALADVQDKPVWVSLAEAKAYCSWAGGRVMTEPEYELAASQECRPEMLEEGGWEWTSTAFAPLTGFEVMAEYPEYSADFFDECHFVIKGSSPYTHNSMIRRSFRNYYQKEYPYVFAKFRVCRDGIKLDQ